MEQENKTIINLSDEDYQEVKAAFFCEEHIIEPTYINYRIDKRGQRFYVRVYDDGTHFVAPSFTEVVRRVTGFPNELAAWMAEVGKDQAEFEKIYSAAYGTFLHIHFAGLLRGDSISLDEKILLLSLEIYCKNENIDYRELMKWYRSKRRKIQDDTIGFLVWMRDYNVRPIAIEYPLMHPEGRCAGTSDIICKMTIVEKIEKEIVEKEIVAMIDIKSGMKSFYESNEIQLHAYSQLWNMEFPELQIERVYDYGCNSFRRKTLSKYLSGGKTAAFKPYRFTDQTESTNKYKWSLYLELYHGNPDNMKIDPTFEYDANIQVDKDTDLSEILKEVNVLDDILSVKNEDEEKEKKEAF